MKSKQLKTDIGLVTIIEHDNGKVEVLLENTNQTFDSLQEANQYVKSLTLLKE